MNSPASVAPTELPAARHVVEALGSLLAELARVDLVWLSASLTPPEVVSLLRAVRSVQERADELKETLTSRLLVTAGADAWEWRR